MGAFLENSMFLLVDDAEPILPIFRSTGHGEDAGRIVELADVGCDTEATFPVYFPRGAFDRRRGGAEGLGSTRRLAKWLIGDKPNGFSRRADVNNEGGGSRSYPVRGKMRRDDDVYIADLDYDYDNLESPYDDDRELSRSDSAVEEEDDRGYAQFVDRRDAVARFRRERMPRYDYSRDLGSSFARNIAPQRENGGRNAREVHGIDVRSGERKKRTKILSRTNGSFDREAEFGKTRERDDFPDAAESIAPTKNTFWDFISFESDTEGEGATFCNPTRTRNHGGFIQKMAPRERRSYVFDSQSKRVDIVDSEGEEETLKRDRRENASPEISSARYRTSKADTSKEKSKILRLNMSNAISSRDQSMKAPVDERISNTYPEKNSINTRPHSGTEAKKIKSPTIQRREEMASVTRTIADDRRYRDRFDELPNNSPKETGRSTGTFNGVADSRGNRRTYVANERDHANSHRGNSGNGKANRINVAASRLASEEKVASNERTFALRMPARASALRADLEKEKRRKFFSRLPVRTWKRLRTREPARLRPENDANGDVNRRLRGAENATARSGDRSRGAENDDVRVKDRTATNRDDVKRSGHFGTGADKGLTSSVLKGMKGIKGSGTTRGVPEQRKKRTSVK